MIALARATWVRPGPRGRRGRVAGGAPSGERPTRDGASRRVLLPGRAGRSIAPRTSASGNAGGSVTRRLRRLVLEGAIPCWNWGYGG